MTPAQTKIRIVLADDHAVLRDGLCKLLELEDDFEVVAQAENGRDVLEILRQNEADILLLDLNMPGMGGLATLQQLQAAHSKLRVILLTASDDDHQFVEALKLGAAGIVLKQAATDSLIDSIRKVHGGEISMDSHTTAAVIERFVSGDHSPQSAEPAAGRDAARPRLSPREHELVSLVAQGLKNADIADKLGISEQTVKNHLHKVFDKLSVTDRLELALYAVDARIHGAAPITA